MADDPTMTSAPPPTDPFDAGAAGYQAYQESVRGRTRLDGTWDRLAGRLPGTGSALDAAGGSGALAARLAAAGLDVVLLERAPSMLRAAAGRLAGVRLVRGDLARPPFAPRRFAVVACHAVMEYLPAWRPALDALAPLLADDGLLSIEALLHGAPGDGRADDVFGVVRHGLRPREVRAAAEARHLVVVAEHSEANRLHLVLRRSV